MRTTAFIIALLALFPIAAHADADDIRALSAARISLVDAIQAAEKETGGKAFEASINDDAATGEYEVGISKDGQSHEVRVNAQNGAIISALEDKDD